MMPGDSMKKLVGLFIPEDETGGLENLTGDELKAKLKEFSAMSMEMFFKEPGVADQSKAVVNQARGQIESLQSILLNIGGVKQEFRPSGDVPGMDEIRQLIDRLRNEGLSISEIDRGYTVFGKSPLDTDIDPATLKVMAQRMSADVSRYRQARMELENQEVGKTPDNDLSPAGASPGPGITMRPGI